VKERKAREALVAYGRRLRHRHLVTGSSGNLSLRLAPDRILITPAGRALEDLAPGDLVLIDASGAPLDSQQNPTSELPLHLAAYRVRDDINCVMHTHPTFCVVWSKTGAIFPRDTVGASESLRDCAWTPYYKNGTQQLADACAGVFESGIDVVMMERHGLSVVAHGLQDAYVQTDLAEEAARIAYYSRFLEQPRS
jgi:L-fuculose-phosphate aldolase